MKRRSFLAAGALSAGVPARVRAKRGANDRIRVGFIGVGGRARWLMQYFFNQQVEAEITAVSDCYLARCYAKDMPLEQRSKNPLRDVDKLAKYQDYRRMFEKEKLDAVFVETTTHARALAVIEALQAGLDVYAEKPLSLTIDEGKALVRAVRKTGRVLQTGSQQRSIPINRYASELVRTGKIGRVKEAVVCNFLAGLEWKPKPAQPLPEGLDWDRWCNQTELRPYHFDLHRTWINWWDYDGAGQSWGVTGWGTHALDQAQCALGMDDTGPVEIWTEDSRTEDAENLPMRKHPRWGEMANRKPVTLRFASGTLLKLEEPARLTQAQLGATFIGDGGKIQIIRGNFSSDPPELRQHAPDPTKEGMGEDAFHLRNFFACMRTRKKPNADVETGHRATTLCHLVNICRKVDRKLRWDPKTETFPDDEEANRLLSRPRRRGYELPKV